VAIESSVGGAYIEVTRLHPTDPRILRQTRTIAHDIGPRFAAVAGELKIAVIVPTQISDLSLGDSLIE